jgi:undecaprenyl diphosphate synthase
VRILWSGQERRLWRSVVKELREAQELTADNTKATLNLCVNYGGRDAITAAARALAIRCARGELDPDTITERDLASHLTPDVDLFVRTSGEQRLSNFLIWESAYAELVFLDKLWPDIDRRDLWAAIEVFASRQRRFGAAADNPL